MDNFELRNVKMGLELEQERPRVGLLHSRDQTIPERIPEVPGSAHDRDLAHREQHGVVALVTDRPIVLVLEHGRELLVNVEAVGLELGREVDPLRVPELPGVRFRPLGDGVVDRHQGALLDSAQITARCCNDERRVVGPLQQIVVNVILDHLVIHRSGAHQGRAFHHGACREDHEENRPRHIGRHHQISL